MSFHDIVRVDFRVPTKYAAALLKAYDDDGDVTDLWELLDRSEISDIDIDTRWWESQVE